MRRWPHRLQGSVDTPTPGAVVPRGILTVSGWHVAHGHPALAVAVSVNGAVTEVVKVGSVPRTDVATALGNGEAARSGWSVDVDLTDVVGDAVQLGIAVWGDAGARSTVLSPITLTIDSSGPTPVASRLPISAEDLGALLAEGARPYGVEPAVHEDDFMWRYIFQSRHLPTPEKAVEYYFSDGATSAQKLKDVIGQYLPSAGSDRPYSLLEFACGYGMVSRHITSVLGNVQLTCCDIHDNAVDFIRDRLGERAVLSAHVPEDVTFDDSFDVVFALSFFSHMPHATFARWLTTLFSAVRPGGILLFTTHGLISAERQGVTIPDDGFWFRSESEQKDLEASEYGTTLTTKSYVVDQLSSLVGASLTDVRSGFWWGHQDLYVVTRTADAVE